MLVILVDRAEWVTVRHEGTEFRLQAVPKGSKTRIVFDAPESVRIRRRELPEKAVKGGAA